MCAKNRSSPSVNKCCSIKYLLLHLQNAYIAYDIRSHLPTNVRSAPLHRLEETRIPGVPWHKKPDQNRSTGVVCISQKIRGNANYRNLTKTIKTNLPNHYLLFPFLAPSVFYFHHFSMAGPPNSTEQCRQELQCTSRLVTGNAMDLNGSQCFLGIKDSRKTEKR